MLTGDTHPSRLGAEHYERIAAEQFDRLSGRWWLSARNRATLASLGVA